MTVALITFFHGRNKKWFFFLDHFLLAPAATLPARIEPFIGHKRDLDGQKGSPLWSHPTSLLIDQYTTYVCVGF